MALTDTAIRKAKPGDKPVKLTDGGGLYLLVTVKGGKWWRFDYRFDGKRKTLSMSTYPDTGLKDAREKRDDARKLLANGSDPAAIRKAQKASRDELNANSFETVAREWITKFSPRWTDKYTEAVRTRLEKNVFPWIGSRPIAEVKAPELLEALRRIESRGAVDTARRVRQYCGQIFRYAIATARAERDPAADLRGALPPVKKINMPAITDPKRVGELLRAIEGYEGSHVTRTALRLASLTFVRPGELRMAEWSELDLGAAEWRIKAGRMKSRNEHIVPLSRQAVETLRDLQPLTGRGKYVFPGVRSRSRPMSENTVNAALRRLGYAKEEMTGHGFRSMASTLLNEQGWNRDAIERQLAHAERDETRAAYHRSQYLDERRRMMQSWADYLDNLAKGADVVPIRKQA